LAGSPTSNGCVVLGRPHALPIECLADRGAYSPHTLM